MTYKQIEAAREARLWLAQIVAPTAIAITATMSVPEIRLAAKAKADEFKAKVKGIKVFKKN